MTTATDTAGINIEALRDNALGVEPVTVDGWSETYGETWDYIEAPDCPECGNPARWDDGENLWRCRQFDCERVGVEVETHEGHGDDGPMMNYYYPLPSLGDADDEYEAADAIRDLPLCVVVWQDGRGSDPWGDESGYALALTGGGMDLSWQICEAFMRLGFLPPAHFADLPGMAGVGDRPDEQAVVRACVRSLNLRAEQYERRAIGARANAENLTKRYTLDA